MTNIRADIFPQMASYDQMPSGRVVPFAMLAGPKSFQSKTINTDSEGFRLNPFNGQLISLAEIADFDKVNFLVGGSTVFGVGATSDKTTISSFLSKKTNELWINLGLRGGVSIQEYIHLIQYIARAKKINNIVLISGVNDFYVNYLYEDIQSFDRSFLELPLELYNLSYKRQILVRFFSFLYRVPLETLCNKSLSEMFFYSKKKLKTPSFVQLDPTERLNKLSEIYQRNFLLYSALSKELNCKVSFALQPYAPWTDKSLTEDELKVLNYLDAVQRDSSWTHVKNVMNNKNAHVKFIELLKNASAGKCVQLLDLNTYFDINKTLFVDNVHLNDEGNELVASILTNLNGEQT